MKVLRNKDLAPKRALKTALGQFRGPSCWTTSKLPQSDFNFRARRVLSQFISVTGGCDKKVRRQIGSKCDPYSKFSR